MINDYVDHRRTYKYEDATKNEKGYSKGDRVIFKFKVYESLIDQNIESPEENPKVWVNV